MTQLHFPEPALSLIGRIAAELIARKYTLGTAESCTGGMAAAMCTALPGSSAWFAGSVVSYANLVKESLLHVPQETLRENGAVSAEVVEAMARGALDTLSVNVALAVSGIAGPDGGSPDKPVGTVWIAAAIKEEAGAARERDIRLRSGLHVFPGNRGEVRYAASLAAFTLVLSL
ncbi:CinA family protein, partial [Desulfovibrio sp. OttesenSCG-928-A18]|nr:CinA family protein [Desulfovibrio sp. OttesenSCG-928-A18]